MSKSITLITYHCERWRALSAGILETAGTTFLLLIAVRAFEAGATAKALVAGGGSIGFIFAPWVVTLVERSRWPVSKAASFLMGIGAASFLIAAVVPVLPVFVVCSLLGTGVMAAMVPLMTHLYHENYPARDRGRLFSKAVMIRVMAAILFSDLAGRFLSGNILDRFRWILFIFSICFVWSAFFLTRWPSHPLKHTGETHPLRAMRFIKTDKLFRRTLISWMLMGVANLMMFSMRVEYLANPVYGMHFDAATTAFLTGVVPNMARLFLSPVWGWLFDRMNFFVLRIVLNIGFALGILTFFTGESMNGLIWGSIVLGISMAGGDLAWGLWVTKIAPPDRVADYMSVHTCGTGLRGLVAPMLAFHLVTHSSMATLGWLCSALIILASLMILPEIWSKRGSAMYPAPAMPKEGIPD